MRLPWMRKREQAVDTRDKEYQQSEHRKPSYDISLERIVEDDGTMQYRAIATRQQKYCFAVCYFESEGEGIVTFEGQIVLH